MDATLEALGAPKVGYGVDVQGDIPVVVRAERTHGRVTWRTVAADDESWRDDLARGTPGAAALSARECSVRWVEAPFASPAKAAKVLPTILDIQLPFALEDCLYTFLDARKTVDNKTTALSLSARREDVAKRIAALGEMGIDPLVLDQEGLALWTQVRRELPFGGSASTVRFILCLGRDSWTLAVGDRRRFLGTHAVRARDAAPLRRLLRLYRPTGGEEPTVELQWVLTGPGACADEELAAARECIGALDPSAAPVVQEEPGTALARALAVRLLTQDPLRCNLRKGDLTHSALSAMAGRRTLRAALVCLSAGVLLILANLVLRALIGSAEDRLDRRFEMLRDDAAGYVVTGAKGADAVGVVAGAVRRRIESLAPFRRAFSPSLLLTLARVAEIAARDGLTIQTLTLSPEAVAINGLAPEWESPEALLMSFKERGYAVALDRGDALGNEAIPFSISGGGGE